MQTRMTRKAAIDVDAIYSYIARNSLTGADNWYDAFFRARSEIEQSPLAYSLTSSAEHFVGEVREHYFRTRFGKWNYSVLYTIVGDIIYIVRVHGPGEDFTAG